DDTLSALDIHTEELVERALKRVLVGVTGIVVAHRASTVLLAHRVAVLTDGRSAHVGTHSDLLATVPEYRELLSAEFNAEAEMATQSPGAEAEMATQSPGAEAARATESDPPDPETAGGDLTPAGGAR